MCFFFKQKTAYEMRSSDWSSDVCSSDLIGLFYNAMFPDRPAGFDWRGVLPGDTSADLWTKTLPFDRVPALVNPRSGYVMNSNNTPWVAAGPGDELDAAAFSPLLGIEDDMTNRAVRLIALYEASGQRSAERRVGEECGSTCNYRWFT